MLWKKILRLPRNRTYSCNLLGIYRKRNVSDRKYSSIMSRSISHERSLRQTLKQLPPQLFWHPNFCLQHYSKARRKLSRELLCKDVKNFNLSQSLCTFVLLFTDSSKAFIHAIISGICHSEWVVLLAMEDWERCVTGP